MKREFMISVYFILSINFMSSQVTIGSGIAPNKGALLDLKENDAANGGASASKGLLLPRVSIINLAPTNDSELAKSIGNTTSDATYGINEHIGLVVYNVNTVETATKRICPGVHFWDGVEWMPIIPYSEIEIKKELEGKITKEFKLFKGSTDPMWEKLGKNPKDYLLGDTPNIEMKDADNNIYKTRRFYVGYTSQKGTFKTTANVSCTDTPNWVTISKEQEYLGDSFVDGVWVLQNVYSTQKGKGGTFTSGGQARINPAFYNKSGGGISVPANAMPSGNIAYTAGTSKVISTNANFVKEFGLLYSWKDAMEVCPEGWHIPNNLEWDAVIVAHGGNTVAGNAMIKKDYSSYTSADNQKLQWGVGGQSGTDLRFGAVPSGNINGGGVAQAFAYQASWWTSQSTDECWYIFGNQSNIFGATNSGYYQSVRCAKD